MSEWMKARALTRRTVLRGIGGAAAMGALAACGATATQAPAATAAVEAAATQAVAATPAAAQAVEVSFWTAWAGEMELPWIEAMVDDFEKANEGITVLLVQGGPGGGDYNELLLTRIAAGNPPDAVSLFTPPVNFAARGSFEAIDEFMATAKYAKPDRFWPQVLETCKWRGKTYGLPFSAGSTGIFYNVDWFEEMGLPSDRDSFPKTFAELQEVSARFTKWEGDELQIAGIIPWYEGWTHPLWAGLNGGQFYNSADEKYYFNSAQNVELLTSWVQWLDDQYGGDVEYLNSTATWNVGLDGAFLQKRMPMGEGGAWSASYDFMNYEKTGFKWDLAKYPVGPSGTTTKTTFWPNWFAQPLGGKHRQEAFLLNEHLCTVGMPIWYQYVFDTPAWLDFPKDVITQYLIDNVGEEKARDINNFFISYLEDAVEVWTSPIEDYARDQIARAVDQVMHKAAEPQAALDEAQQITQTQLEEMLKSV